MLLFPHIDPAQYPVGPGRESSRATARCASSKACSSVCARSDSIERTNRESRSNPAPRTPPHTAGPINGFLKHLPRLGIRSFLSREIRATDSSPRKSSHRPPGCPWVLAKPFLLFRCQLHFQAPSRSSAGSHLAGQRCLQWPVIAFGPQVLPWWHRSIGR